MLFKAEKLVYNGYVFPQGEEEESAMTDLNGTTKFSPIVDAGSDASSILAHVYRALQAKGYDPITQLTGFILTGDPTYITSFDNARSMICRLERDEILEEIVSFYMSENFDQ